MAAVDKPGTNSKTEVRATELREAVVVERALDAFCQAADKDGLVTVSELQAPLEKLGLRFNTVPQMRSTLTEALELQWDQKVSCKEFFELFQKVRANQRSQNKATSLVRVPRNYLTPDQMNQYSNLFRKHAQEDEQLDVQELKDFFSKYNMNITPERLQQVMAEVDDDNSGQLDVHEFLILIIKAVGIKKRKIGPGMCPLSLLRDEGWQLADMRRLGYECKDFVDANYQLLDLMEVFGAPDLRKGGFTVQELVDAGWDGTRGKEAGFTVESLVQAKCPSRKIRDAGFDDVQSAVALRQLGVSAHEMRQGGWPLSMLRMAGYSFTDLRCAGFSAASVTSVQRIPVAPV
eukprot:gnl/TRDRNA2_/TRDRNA2_188752_c0_seq1.p1 gnl/TRDRNA2_/TRDRNA2_188752_c0~~gnl/TRDRNA2_/TRDRNA2_188752_c0_seq1.p1  ORF type:complete len:347 (+),score=89.69 gnl/TRDRNA2_/TRDRNA2_188752_c0_seq1:22-1062(+)